MDLRLWAEGFLGVVSRHEDDDVERWVCEDIDAVDSNLLDLNVGHRRLDDIVDGAFG